MIQPSKIIGVGLNYRDHAEEANLELPPRPLLFAKWPNSLIRTGEPIILPSISQQVDYEAELGVIIGESARNVAVEDALEIVLGYVPLNDVSARDLQFGDGQFTRGKSLDTFCPVGELVPREDVPDPQALPIRCLLNGDVVQSSTTKNMIFGVAELIAYITEGIRLEPGDLIATGTPSGVGFARKPPRFLRHGDEVTVEIEGVGAVTNIVRAPE